MRRGTPLHTYIALIVSLILYTLLKVFGMEDEVIKHVITYLIILLFITHKSRYLRSGSGSGSGSGSHGS